MSYASQKHNRNIFDRSIEMYFHEYFQTDVLINFFIPLRRAEVTWENFASAKRDPGSTKEGSRLAGMKLFTCNRRM